jgi:hypothetical protein
MGGTGTDLGLDRQLATIVLRYHRPSFAFVCTCLPRAQDNVQLATWVSTQVSEQVNGMAGSIRKLGTFARLLCVPLVTP